MIPPACCSAPPNGRRHITKLYRLESVAHWRLHALVFAYGFALGSSASVVQNVSSSMWASSRMLRLRLGRYVKFTNKSIQGLILTGRPDNVARPITTGLESRPDKVDLTPRLQASCLALVASPAASKSEGCPLRRS